MILKPNLPAATNSYFIPAVLRAQTPLFVEARGYLQPAVDFFSRAVFTAEQNDNLTGNLLASVSLHIATSQRADCSYMAT
jgi:hypothetical protein